VINPLITVLLVALSPVLAPEGSLCLTGFIVASVSSPVLFDKLVDEIAPLNVAPVKLAFDPSKPLYCVLVALSPVLVLKYCPIPLLAHRLHIFYLYAAISSVVASAPAVTKP
jgi:hypothetical protein